MSEEEAEGISDSDNNEIEMIIADKEKPNPANPTNLFATSTVFYIKQKLLTTEYCLCCWSVDGKYYEIRVQKEATNDYLFRADEDIPNASVTVKDGKGLVFMELLGYANCQCGCLQECHRKIDVVCTPGRRAGTIHYVTPSAMYIKGPSGELVFRIVRHIPSHPNLEKEDSSTPPKFEAYFVSPGISEVVGTISKRSDPNRQEKGKDGKECFDIVVQVHEDLDLEAKTLIVGASFPIALAYYETDDKVFESERRASKMSVVTGEPRRSIIEIK